MEVDELERSKWRVSIKEIWQVIEMTREEYKKELRNLGWDEDYIDFALSVHDEAVENGISIPYEQELTKDIRNPALDLYDCT